MKISVGMISIMVAVENYSELKASDNFMNLQSTLNVVESQISAVRRKYNAVVTDYNNGIQTFPGNVMSGMMNFRQKEGFMIPVTERQNANINQLFN
jgi:LemA protein